MAKGWSGASRGGRFGNWFFVVLIGSPLHRVTPFFLFFVSFYFVFASPKGTRSSFELARRLGRGQTILHRILFAWRHNFEFGTQLIDRIAILGGFADRYTLERPTREVLLPIDEGNGLVCVTAHFGNWYAMSQTLTFDEPLAVNMVMRLGMQPELRRLIDRERGFNIIESDGSASTAAEILDALGRGELVALAGDRLTETTGVTVKFLGADVSFPVGAYAFAALGHAPHAYMFAIRTGSRRYRFVAEPAGECHYRNRRQKQADHQIWAQAFADRLEHYVREDPFQWGNFFSIWEAQAPDPVS
jgi:predicted LPLAT superfamily acyltransferase